jgi:HPt (histidine-containing phosphotransfer) domain-containing protein
MAELLAAYRDEAAERLTVLETALGEPKRPQDARRAAHALGSSAWVVGEREVSAIARDVEARIESRRDWVEQAHELVQLMRVRGIAS